MRLLASERPQVPPLSSDGALITGIPLPRETLGEVVELAEDPAPQPLLIFPSSHDHRELFIDEPLALVTTILRN